ncbi:MAG: glycosyltransferase, partial [Verrucomicrobiota bacterium]
RRDVVFVGRLTAKKGCKYLILAMLLLARRGHHYHLHIIGDGRLRRELENLALPLGAAVSFHGQRNPDFVRDMVAAAAVFCVPSVTGDNGDSEGLPMVNLEALALRTPVVSTMHSGIPEAVLHEQTGILVPEADPEALAAALLRCLTDAPLARRFADNGLAHVQRNFDLRQQCHSLEAIYDSVAPGR